MKRRVTCRAPASEVVRSTIVKGYSNLCWDKKSHGQQLCSGQLEASGSDGDTKTRLHCCASLSGKSPNGKYCLSFKYCCVGKYYLWVGTICMCCYGKHNKDRFVLFVCC